MLSASSVILLRLAHILIGAFWVGSMVVMAVFIIPSVRAIGPAGGAMMQQLIEVRKATNYFAAAAIITVLSGVALYWNASLGFSHAWLSSPPGRTFGAGGALAIVALLIGLTVNAPSGNRLLAIGHAVRAAGGPPSAEQLAEMDRLQKRLFLATRVIAVLILLATAAMAAARYTG